MTKNARSSELYFLQWYYANHDFGPAHEDVVEMLKEAFVEDTGLELPEGYEFDD